MAALWVCQALKCGVKHMLHFTEFYSREPAIRQFLEDFLGALSFLVDALENFIPQISWVGTMSGHMRRILWLRCWSEANLDVNLRANAF